MLTSDARGKLLTASLFKLRRYFLERLDQQQSHEPANIGKQMFSTHPGTRERINNVTRQINQSKVSGGATLKGRFEANMKPN